jgi:penicillin-binding protein 1A
MPDNPLSIISYSGSRDPVPPRISSRRIFGQFVFLVLILLSGGIGALAGLLFVYSSDLPQVRELEDYRPDVMTELYADDGVAIGSFALEHRVIVTYNQIPPVLRDAVLSVEDRHFENHWGIDVLRIVRAGLTDLLEWRKAQGASTLTQQLSRKLFLTPEKSFRRKIQEALLAIQIERHFTKEQIFTMYANQVDLGHGNFGFEAAAQFYFGKHLNQLTLPQAAVLAGIPRTPTAYSPLMHPDAALRRRNQVLAAMLENQTISPQQFHEALAAPLGLHIQRWGNTNSPYFVEEVRQFLERKYGLETVHEKGLRVYTTLNIKMQKAAEAALRQGLRDDDKRRGWRGPETNILQHPLRMPDGKDATLTTYVDDDWRKPPEPGDLINGLVMEVKPDYAVVRFGQLTARVTAPDFSWTHETEADALFFPGDVDLFLVKDAKGQTVRVSLDQPPTVQGAILAIDNATGAVKAMVGGYDWNESKFNRAVQAERQVGSSFKVYVYTQALLDGMQPFDTVVDNPVSYHTSSGWWSPHNFDSKYEGTITLLHALAESRNIPAVRLLAKVGVDKVIKLCRKFGVASRLVPNLPLALGASDLTLLEHTSAFTVFPDDGVHISPRMVYRVTNYDGRVIDDFPPEVTDVIPAPVARLMVAMLREPFNSGTAIRARAFAQKYPIAGKTGTTNDFTDAWFLGFSPSITCGVYVGFDDHRSLGDKEEGSHVALPIWLDFMSEFLKDAPAEDFSHSPFLVRPEQVQEILASAGPGQFMTEKTSAKRVLANESAAGRPQEKHGSISTDTRIVQEQRRPRPVENPSAPSSQTKPEPTSTGETKPVARLGPAPAQPKTAQTNSKDVGNQPAPTPNR